MPRKGRDTEIAVELLHKLIIDPKCKIKSPDYFIDKITGQRREVDISIKYCIGYIPILIVIECRDRSEKEDVTWIEQLATKHKNINANKLIAVSSTGFSQPAIKLAQHYDIITQIISEINLEDVKSWFAASSLEIYYNYFNLKNVSLGLAGYNTNNFKMKSDERIFIFEGEYYSFNDIFQTEALNKNPHIFNDIEVNGLKRIKKFNFNIPKKYSIKAPDYNLYYLESFAGECELWIEVAHIPFLKLLRLGDDNHTLVEMVGTGSFKIGSCTYEMSSFKTCDNVNVTINKIDDDKSRSS